MDFYQILVKEPKDKEEPAMYLYPDFIVGRSEDLMVQGGRFYAIWDETKGLWSRDEYDVQRLVDEDLWREAERLQRETGQKYLTKSMKSFGSSSWKQFRQYVAHLSDSNQPLDSKLVFANTEVTKADFASKRLPYSLAEGATPAWDELMSTLYSPEERAKIEWAIGSIVSGDSKTIQKFLVFYGPAGTGKSTVLNLIGELFDGYTTSFDGKALGSTNSSFATEAFKNNPLVAIQHDGDLSKIDDNTRLNSIIAHEEMQMNEKYKPAYTARVNAMLFMGSNQPVKITDAKSGIIRRLIDVTPTGVKLTPKHYQTLMTQVKFELGAIAHKCLSIFLSMGKDYYSAYRPLEMMLQTDVFFNFIEAHFDVFKGQDKVTLQQAYKLYKAYCDESGIERPLPQYKMREELRNYFENFHDRAELDGIPVRSLYSGFVADRFKAPKKDTGTFSLVLDRNESILDELLADYPAQLAKADGTPRKRWADVTTKLSDIDSHEIHYVKVPENHVVIDFDLKADNGTKALERNLEAASVWPPTYGEVSKSGEGVHLHYTFTGDVSELAPAFSDGIEVKVYSGDASLRRRVSLCNGVPVSEISSGLPLKEKKDKMLQEKTISSEQGLRKAIERNLNKEIHFATKPSIDFIKHILDEAYDSGITYDVTDMRPRIIVFANNSTNQAQLALKVVRDMKWQSKDVNPDVKPEEAVPSSPDKTVELIDDRLAFFDVEVYQNLFVICWKFHGSDEIQKMINPKPHEVAELFKLKLVGFYNRRYDNHIIYAAAMGESNLELFDRSSKMVNDNNQAAKFSAAYNLSYADIWDFSSIKQSLKKFEIDLGILHMELEIPWDKPVEEKDWQRVVDYCCNDVLATEAVFEDRKGDFVARQILAELSGMSVNDTTQNHTAKIIFGENRKPQSQFVYTDLSKTFPGYSYSFGQSEYKGENPSEGGYVYAEPGMYRNVAVLDVASMHPTSIIELNAFGPYTSKFKDLLDARIAIKRKNFDLARTLLDGRLSPFLEGAEADSDGADALAYALKIVINIVYGLTSAKFDNPFRDIRNVDNIVAKRGALFMIDLKETLHGLGQQVVHIKTDSVKIPDATPEIINTVVEFGKKYGYDFEHEVTYDRFCLVNDAVYIAGKKKADTGFEWDATGAQFAHAYVFKSLFSGEPINFDDLCEGRSVMKGAMYLYRGNEEDLKREEGLDAALLRHVGKTGLFVPVNENGAILYRFYEGKYHAVAGTKGHRWIEADVAFAKEDQEALEVDYSYFEKLKEKAVQAIEEYGPLSDLVN